MQTPAKPQQKSYRKGSSLYFSAGLVVSMILIITAFEWKTPHGPDFDGPINPVNDPEGPIIEFEPVVMPVKPTPRKISPNIDTTPDASNDIDIDLTPPEIDEPEGPEGDENPDLTSIFGAGKPDDHEAGMPNISYAAVPPQGYEAFHAYIFERLKIPEHLIRQNIDGKVHVSFVVDTDGKLTDIQIIRGFDKKLEEQIIKLLEDAPAWEPAWQQGSKVKMRMQLPITIKINN